MVRNGIHVPTGNSKLTDYFSRPYSLSQSQPTTSIHSTRPVFSTQVPSSPTKTNKSTLPSTKSQKEGLRMPSKSSSRCQPRDAKKENAPPFSPSLAIWPDSEVISISSEAPSHISISSDSEAPTHITISSTSVISIDSSIPEIVEIRHVKKGRQCLGTHNTPTQSRREGGMRFKKPVIMKKEKVMAPKKRKRSDSTPSDSGQLGNTRALEESIYATSKTTFVEALPPKCELPSQSMDQVLLSSQQETQAKQSYLLPLSREDSPDGDSVIPSSQSDENIREISLLKMQPMNKHDIEQSVLAWQKEIIAACLFDPGYEELGPPPSSDTLTDDSLFSFEEFLSKSPPHETRSKSPVTSPTRDEHLPTSDTPSRIPFKSPVQSSETEYMHSPMELLSPLKEFSLPDRATEPKRSQDSSASVSAVSSLTKVDHMIPLSTQSTPKIHELPMADDLSGGDSPMQCSPSTPHLELAETSADRVIADIKARAEERVRLDVDMDEIDLNMDIDPLSESDSDPDDLCFMNIGKKSDDPKTTLTPLTMNFSISTTIPSHETSSTTSHQEQNDELRKQPDPSSPMLSSRSTRIRNIPARGPVILSALQQTSKGQASRLPPKKKPVDPFASLFAEKEKEEKALQLRNLFISEKNSEIEGEVMSEDEDDEMERSSIKLGPNHLGLNSFISECAAKRGKVLGKMSVTKYRDLIENTIKFGRLGLKKGRQYGQGVGVPLWEKVDTLQYPNMEKNGIPSLSMNITNPLLCALNECILMKDIAGINLLLQSDTLPKSSDYISWLVETSICCCGSLADTAFASLLKITESQPTFDSVPCLNTLNSIVNMCRIFRAEEGFLDLLGKALLKRTHSTTMVPGGDDARNKSLWRLAEICIALGKKKFISPKLVPDLVLVLQRIGMDVDTDLALGASLKRAIHVLCVEYCGGFSDRRGDIEFLICTKLIQLAKDLSLTNQEYFLSFIEGDSLITRRIAQWVAYSMLSGEYGIQLASKQSKAVPELVDILGLLKISISSNSQEQSRPSLFELRRNPDIESDTDTNSDADYSILSQRITLLSYVLMNIPQFDKVDNGSGSSLLDMIVKELEKIQNNIDDRRVASVERSLAKANIELLCLRIQSQRVIIHRGTQESLRSYFLKE